MIMVSNNADQPVRDFLLIWCPKLAWFMSKWVTVKYGATKTKRSVWDYKAGGNIKKKKVKQNCEEMISTFADALISRFWRCWRCLTSRRWYCSCVEMSSDVIRCMVMGIDTQCHRGRGWERGKRREGEGSGTQGTLEEIHSICTYLSGWIPQSRMLIFTS